MHCGFGAVWHCGFPLNFLVILTGNRPQIRNATYKWPLAAMVGRPHNPNSPTSDRQPPTRKKLKKAHRTGKIFSQRIWHIWFARHTSQRFANQKSQARPSPPTTPIFIRAFFVNSNSDTQQV